MPNPSLTNTILARGEIACVALIDGMDYDSGYYLNWGNTNVLDVAKMEWHNIEASAAMIFQSEENADNDPGGHQNAYQNYATYKIQVAIPISTESGMIEIDHFRLATMALDDLKKLFAANPSPGDVWEDMQYDRAEMREDDRIFNDVFWVVYLDTYWTVRYMQSRTTIYQVAS
jgi:hypothetical protein